MSINTNRHRASSVAQLDADKKKKKTRNEHQQSETQGYGSLMNESIAKGVAGSEQHYYRATEAVGEQQSKRTWKPASSSPFLMGSGVLVYDGNMPKSL